MAATRAGGFGVVMEIQFFAAAANPANQSRWVAPDQRVRRHIPCDHRAGSNHRPASDGNRQKGGVGADGAALLQVGSRKMIRIFPAARTQVVGEGRARPHKYVVFKDCPFPEIDTTFDGHAIAHPHAFFKKGVVAEIAILADDRAIADMGKRPNPRARADDSPRINEGLGVKGHQIKS